MSFDPNYIIFSLTAYLLGSISTAIITCKLMGLEDPRSAGSNNPGATNVLRTGGKKAAIITLLGDMLKGLLPVFVVQQLQADAMALAITGISAFLGHLYPLYYRFKGGKGVATFYGVLLGVNWMIGLAALVVWGLVMLLFRISGLSALISAFSSPFIVWYLDGSVVLIAAVSFMAILLIWRHRSNIRQMLNNGGDKTTAKPE
ncbi:MAG: glycerol-3-phosphate 1-O-acyltransferase PlsY [Gammaproteobacteria bacterium]|nr:glycerol-3-phosphate 1-O-acyltransferase PlsY [Gammaproteobacteria bacterium]